MYPCTYSPDCPNEKTLDFDFCAQHLNSPRGRQHALDIIASGDLTRPSEITEVVKAAAELPELDVQTHVLEKMDEALTRILEWETESRNMLFAIPKEEWRYLSRERTEQARTEVKVYEAAMDRTVRTLATVSKTALRDKMISLGRKQSELMIKILLGVIGDMRLEANIQDKARYLLLERFKEEANLAGRVEAKVAQELDPSGQWANAESTFDTEEVTDEPQPQI